LKFSNVQVQKNRFDRRVMAEKDPLLNCNVGCLPTHVRNRFRKLKADIGVPANVSLAPAESRTNPFRPVAAVSPTTITPKFKSIDTESATLHYMSTAQVGFVNDSRLKLTNGEVVAVTNKDVAIETECGAIQLAPNTVAVIRSKNGLTSVQVIYEERDDAVHFVNGDRAIKIAIGNELLCAPTSAGLTQFLKSDYTGRRRVRSADLPNGASVMTSEIPFMSVFGNSGALREMFKSEEEDHKAVCKKVAKSAVALSVITARHGAFGPLQQGK
jgi:hypothetical protein